MDFENVTSSSSSSSSNESVSYDTNKIIYNVILLTAYTTAIALAFVGNLITIAVFSVGRRSRTDLRIFLISLAVSDLLVGVFCLPFTFSQMYLGLWPFPALLCPVVLFLQLLAVTSSVFTNMAIGLDRFWVVTFPLKHRLSRTQSKIVLFVIWGISSAVGFVQFFVGKVRKRQCTEHWGNDEQRMTYTIIILLLTYIVPLTILLVTYSIVGIKLWRRSVPGNADEQRDIQQLQSKRKIIKMLVVIVVLFGVCWLPLHVFFLIGDFGTLWGQLPQTVVMYIFSASHWLAMANSFVNPIIYGFMNDSFRVDLAQLVYRICPCLPNRHAAYPHSAAFSRAATTEPATYHAQKLYHHHHHNHQNQNQNQYFRRSTEKTLVNQNTLTSSHKPRSISACSSVKTIQTSLMKNGEFNLDRNGLPTPAYRLATLHADQPDTIELVNNLSNV